MKCSALIGQHRFVGSMRLWIMAWGLLLPAFAHAQALIYLVGNDGACDFTTIQAAINAAAAHSGPDVIHVAMNATYTAQALTIGSGDLEIDGGFADCASPTATSRTTISGAGGGNSSVLRITGSGGRVLRHLAITGGDAPSDGNGGGIDFNGTGEVNLGDVIVSGNYAGYGGGIHVAGGVALLTLEADVVVVNNTAQFSGGGIRLEGATRLVMLADGIAVTGNEAIGIDPINNQPKYGNGGGVEVVGPASADIGSPGLGNSGVIYANTARYGGGIAIAAPDTSDDSLARVRLFSTDATRPVRIHGNRATQAGGGVYVLPNKGLDNTSPAFLCAFDFRIEDNRAQQGSAIYADTSSDAVGEDLGGQVGLNVSPDDAQYGFYCDGPALPALGAVACASGTPCNTISGNVAEDENGDPTAGAAILIDTGGTLAAHRVIIADNVGSQAMRLISGGTFDSVDGSLVDCLIADNAVTGELIRTEGDASGANRLSLDNCTLTNNAIGATQVLSVSSTFALTRSVLWQPGKTSLQQSGGSRDVSDVVTSERFSLDGGSEPSVIEADPRFIDPDHADYHLQAASPAVDFAVPVVGDDRDLENLPRDQDLLVVPDRYGDRDLGAYERRSLLPLVLNKDFDTDLRLWSVVTLGVATWDNSTAPGSGGGSVLVLVSPPVVGDAVGLSQCVHIPGPGDYQLTGSGYGGGTGVTRDSVRLHWSLRTNPGGEICSGSTAAEGDLGLPGSSTWGTPLVPALISVPQNEWTRNSSVEVTLVVHENGTSTVGATVGHFDDIRLEQALDDVIFADGFDGP